jgi:ubiquinone/menaquinone biosynthesis C-methylase UbiE
VGCGGAKFTKYVADQRPDVQLVGIDLSKPQIARAAKLMSGYGDRVRFEIGDATQLAFPDASFDGVLSYGSIKHWTSRDAGLAECIRVLKPGGPLLVTDADRSATFEDSQNLVANCTTPRFLGGPNLAFFRTWIAGGRSTWTTLATSRAASTSSTKTSPAFEGLPLLMLSGRKPE